MKFRQLGKSTLRVSEVSLGSWLTYGAGVERSQAAACVRQALELGINLIDTANVYGRGAAETFLGEALAGVPRDSYVLATKPFFPMSPPTGDCRARRSRSSSTLRSPASAPTTSICTNATATTQIPRRRRRWRR